MNRTLAPFAFVFGTSSLLLPASAVELPKQFQASLPERVGPGKGDLPSEIGDRPLAEEAVAQQTPSASNPQ